MNEDPSYGFETSAPPPGPPPGPGERVNASAKVWWDFLEKRYWISFDYHQEFIEFLKVTIPKRARGYDKASRCWNFGRAYLSVVEAEARKVFPDLIVEREPPRTRKPRAPRTEPVPDPRSELIVEFFDALPLEAIKSAYRKGAMLTHPDRGGSTEAMQYLNDLWEQIEEKIFHKRM